MSRYVNSVTPSTTDNVSGGHLPACLGVIGITNGIYREIIAPYNSVPFALVVSQKRSIDENHFLLNYKEIGD